MADNNLSIFNSTLATTSTEKLTAYDSTTTTVSLLPSFLNVTISNGGLLNGSYDAWCANSNLEIRSNILYNASIYSTYGNIPTGVLQSGSQTVDNTTVDPFLDKLQQINWLFNNVTQAANVVGNKYSYGGVNYTWGDVQLTIWNLLGDTVDSLDLKSLGDSSNPTYYSQTNVNTLVALAQANGSNFVPTAGQDVAVIASGVDSTGNKVQPVLLEVNTAGIGDFVWEDKNANGIQDAGEAGIDGVTVTLLNASGTVIGTTITGDNPYTTQVEKGYYQFGPLLPSTYQVRFSLPTGFNTVSPYLQGSNTALDSNGNPANNLTSTPITLVAGQVNKTIDAGFYKFANISGTVYVDANNNGVLDTGETGIAGTTVILTGTDNLGNTVTVNTTTDANGNYTVGNLRPGTYQLVETQPTGFLDGKDSVGSQGGTLGNDQFSNIVLTSGTNGVNNNFGELNPANISGTVYVDANNNGVLDAGETGIAGTTVILTGTDNLGNTVTVNTTTDANGNYTVGNLRPGTYQLSETQPNGYLDGKDSVGSQGGTLGNDQFSNIVLNSGTNGVNNNFGELNPASISGTVYVDANNNGVLDAGETGIAGTTVILTGTNDLGNTVTVNTTTDANGNYTVGNLRPGTYQLVETQPTGFLDGKDSVGSQGGTLGNDQFSNIVLNSGTNGVNNNFGELNPASISGTVYVDANNNGVLDAGETGIAGTTVILTGTNDLGNAVNVSVTTDANGNYAVANLRPGTYQLSETQPTGFLDGKDSVGSQGGTLGNDQFSNIVLNSGTNGVNNNFGELNAASISGTVYVDANNNGVLDAGETGIAGTTVILTGTDNLGNTVTVNTTTDANGNYTVGNLRPGTYQLSETQPNGYLDGKDSVGSQGGTLGNDQFSNIVLNSGTNGVNNNFGELNAASISGTVYVDANNNGVLDAGETGIAGTTVILTGTNDLGNTVTVNTTTDANGNYTVGNLRPGTYQLVETQPTGFLDGKDSVGSQGGTLGNDQFSNIVLNSGTNGVNNNFGELNPASISGTVYVDANNNGVKDGSETGIAGTTVILTGTNDLGNAVNVSVTTDANGNYAVGNLRPGTYQLSETQPTGFLDGKDSVGSQGGTLGNDQFSNIVLNSGTNGVNNNFGELNPASISGTVYVDANNNGVLDAGETGIAGTTVILTGTNDLGNAVNVSVTTDANGNYAVGNLRPGTYQLSETQPNGYLDGKDSVGSQGGTLGNDQFSNIVLNSGTNGVNNNFGELNPASISGTVYVDANNNGVKDGSETGIAGTTVGLAGTDDLGNTVSIITTTDANGNYQFTNLRPGTNYTLIEGQPNGYLDGKDSVGSQGGTLSSSSGFDFINAITLNSGTNGVNNNFGELNPASISGTVYVDANNNGVKDGSETGIAGTTVILTGTNDLGNAVNVSVTTDANGNYTVANLRPGTYQLNETQPTGFLDGKDSVGSQGGTLGNDQFSNIVLNSGTNGVNNNFGELNAASISGTVYVDANNNGVKDGSETGIAGTTVILTGTNDLGNAVNVSVTTDANGNYTVANLRPGTYQLNETQPTGFLDGKDSVGSQGGTLGNDQFSNIVLNSGTNGVNNNFGELNPASISGTVYVDANNNGVKDGSETGIAGTTVILTGTNDLGQAVSVTKTTDANGNYTVGNLRPGTYTLNETQPNGYLDGKDSVGSQGGTLGNDQFSNIVLNSGTNGVNNNFGELNAASISGTVYVDANNNGVKDGSETGIAGTTVGLAGTDDLGNTVSIITTTDANGNYQFTNLRPGTNYTLIEGQPNGYLDGKDSVGSQGGTLSSSSGFDFINAITLNSGTNGVNNNFGELNPASISGTVYVDANNNGVKDGSETGIAGTTVILTGTNDLGNAVNVSVTTDANGNYTVGNLRPGTYQLNETQPTGFLDGKDSVGSQGGTLGNDQFSNIVLNSGTNGVNNNFGELNPASISGTVYVDANNNGVKDGSETGIAGTTVILTGTNDLGQAVSVTKTTDANGNYTVGNLRPGTYTLNETQPTGFLDGKDSVGSQGGTLGNDQFSNIVLNSGTNGVNNNFGELNPASISGTVYVDANNNGVKDGSETGIAGTTVILTGTNDLGNAVNVSVTTDANGNYTVGNLRPGTYQLSETQPNGYLDGKDSVGSQGGTLGNDQFSNIVLNSGTNGVNNNFGELVAASLGDRVWQDSNANGIQDANELGVSGVTVSLIGGGADGIINGVGDTTLTTTTNASGIYGFTGLTPGQQYQVAFSNLPTGYQFTQAYAGSNNASDSDANTSTGKTQIVTLASGENNLSLDAGIYQNAGDLSITKTDGLTTVNPGQQITYTIVAQNNGLITATNALVSDIIPSLLTNVTWTSVAAGGAKDNQTSGTGSINDSVTLTAGSSITYTVTGTVDPNALLPTTNNNTSSSGSNSNTSSGSVCDFGSGTNNTKIGQSTTSNCVKAEALCFSNGSYQSSNNVLWQRNQTDNRGLGCSSSTQSSSYGWIGNTFNNIISQPTKDVIRLTKNDGDQWKSLCVSSLGTSSSGCTDKGTLYWSNSANPNLDTLTTKCTVQYGDFGNGVKDGDLLSISKLSNFDCNAKYVFWVAEKNSDGSANDCSLWKTTTCPATTTTGTLSNTATLTAPTGFTDTNLSNNSATDTDTVVAAPKVKIGDRVWYDTNGNGVQDTGELGVAGVSVKLLNQAGTQVGTTTTDANGLYQFTANGNSTYSVQFVQPTTGFNGFTTANVGNDAADSDVVNANGTTAQFSVGTSDNFTIDAGLTKNTGDLSITKNDGLTLVAPGQQLTYTIVVSNTGNTATNALVSDLMPSLLTNIVWTSVATGGATNNQASGTGNINDYVTLVSGSNITYTVNGIVSANASSSSSSSNCNTPSSSNCNTSTTVSLINTATVTAPTDFTDTNLNNNSATDTDTVVAAPGVRTSGFWQNTTWQKFWDGTQGNEPSQKTQANFPNSDLLFAPYTNSAQPGKVLDPVSGQYDIGLLIGDFNRNGKTDPGEDTIFYTKAQALQILDASQQPDKNDVRYTLGRDVVATWLNYLAGNPIDTANTTDQDARYYLKEGINWLQAVTPDENGDKKGDGAMNKMTGNATSLNTPAIAASSSYWTTGISSASSLSNPYGLNTSVAYSIDAGNVIHTKLDDYNNGRGLADGVYYGGN